MRPKYYITRTIVHYADGTKLVSKSPLGTDNLEQTRLALEQEHSTQQSCYVLFHYEEFPA